MNARQRWMGVVVTICAWMGMAAGVASGQELPPPVAPFMYDGGVHFVCKGLSALGPGGLIVTSTRENAGAVEVLVLTGAGEILADMSATLEPGELEQFVGTQGEIVLVAAPRLPGAPPGTLLLSVPPTPGEIPRRVVAVGVCQSDAKTALSLETEERLFLTVSNTGRCRLRVYVWSRNTLGERRTVAQEYIRPGATTTIDRKLEAIGGLATVTKVELQCFDNKDDQPCTGELRGSLTPERAGSVSRKGIVSGATVMGDCPSDRQQVFMSDQRGVFAITVTNPPTRPDGTATCPFRMEFMALRFESKDDWDARARRLDVPPGGTAQILFDNRKFQGVVEVDIICGDPGDGCLANVTAFAYDDPKSVQFPATSVAGAECDTNGGLWFSSNLQGTQTFKVSVTAGSCPVEMTVKRGTFNVPTETQQFGAGLSRSIVVPNPNPAWIAPDGKIPDMYEVHFTCRQAPPAVTCDFSVEPSN